MKNKSHDDIENNSRIEFLLKIVSILLIVFCILATVLLIKINDMNNNLDKLSYIIKNETESDEYKDIIDVFVEETNEPEEMLPMYDEIKDKNSEEQLTTNKQDEPTKIDTATETTYTNVNEETTKEPDKSAKITYVINVNSKKIHYNDCSFVSRMKEENKEVVKLSKNELNNHLNNGYTFCSTCGG